MKIFGEDSKKRVNERHQRKLITLLWRLNIKTAGRVLFGPMGRPTILRMFGGKITGFGGGDFDGEE